MYYSFLYSGQLFMVRKRNWVVSMCHLRTTYLFPVSIFNTYIENKPYPSRTDVIDSFWRVQWKSIEIPSPNCIIREGENKRKGILRSTGDF